MLDSLLSSQYTKMLTIEEAQCCRVVRSDLSKARTHLQLLQRYSRWRMTPVFQDKENV